MFCLLLTLFLFVKPPAYADNPFDSAVSDVLGELDYSSLDTLLGESGAGYEAIKEFIESGSITALDAKELFLSVVLGSVKELFPKVSALLAISLCGIFAEIFKPSDGLASGVISLGGGIVGLSVFIATVSEARKTIRVVSNAAEAFFPVLLALTVAGGGKSSAAIFQPAVAILLSGVTAVTDKLLLPLCSAFVAVGSCGALSKGIKLKKTADFFKSTFKWVLGFSGVAFCFFITTKGLAASSYDGFSLRALKYAFSSGSPAAGQFISGGFDVVCAATLFIKNAFGIVAAVALCVSLALPIARAGVASLGVRLASAVGEGAEGCSATLSVIADGLSYVSAMLIVVGACFSITLFLAACSVGGL